MTHRVIWFSKHFWDREGRYYYYTWSEKLNDIFSVTQTANFGFLVQNSLNLGLFPFHCLWSWIRELWQCVAPAAGVVSMSRKIKMRLMRFLIRQPGWPSRGPWRADGQREIMALRAKAEHSMGRHDKSNWAQSSVRKIVECKEIKQPCHKCHPREWVPNSPVQQLLAEFVSNAPSPVRG